MSEEATSIDGVPLLFFSLRHHLRVVRLLSRGLMTMGTIEKVEMTGVIVNQGRRYKAKATVRFRADGVERTGTCFVYGGAAMEGQRLAGTGEPVRVLHYPADPRRMLWAGSLAPVPPEPR